MPTTDQISTVAAEAARRRDRVQTALTRRGSAALLVYATGAGESAGIVRWLTGWMPGSSEACLIVPSRGRSVLVSADKNRARAFAQRAAGTFDVVKTTDLMAALAAELQVRVPTGELIVAGAFDLTLARDAQLRAATAGRSSVVDESLVTAERPQRSEFDVAKQLTATRVADAMVEHAMGLATVPRITAADIMIGVENVGRRHGADRSSCWLTVEDRPAETYFELFELVDRPSTAARLQIGTTVMLDGYFSQVLRIGVYGEPSARLVEVADELVALQDRALASLTPGSPVTVLGDTLEAGIDRLCPYPRAEDPFRFQSCHAMGSSYAEPWAAPFLAADRNRADDGAAPLLAPNQVFEVHPNFTLPDVGHVCAGDVALVTDAGGTWISRAPRGIRRLG